MYFLLYRMLYSLYNEKKNENIMTLHVFEKIDST